ncbi:MAG: L-2-amino-thiazoline-4-carboxylic acid hydrolase [Eubacteriales bacterium]|nr:L-2-amino-thiazoline-4-carboxylic acid hydrolase [Eubacteriales bacterium]
MKDRELPFDRTCHVLYSRPCQKQICAKIALHYPKEKREAVWEKVQRQYVTFLSDWRTDLGGKKNFHNGVGGTYDCIAIMSYYVVCRSVTSVQEIGEIEENLILPSFRKLRFVDCNKPFWKRLLYKAFTSAKSGCDKWHDYEMAVAPYGKDKPVSYEFTACPIAEFAGRHGLTDIMPALCNVDFPAMELLRAKLVRTTTCANGEKCDYTICGDQDPWLREHPEYWDEAGYRKNK